MMTRRAYILFGLMLLFALICTQVFLKYESNKICSQLQEIRSGKREGFSAIFPLSFHEMNLCFFAQDLKNPSRAMNALNLLGGMKSKKGREIIEDYLASNTPRFRAIAVDCLSYYADRDMCTTLVHLLENEDDLKVYVLASGVLTKHIEYVEQDTLKAMMDAAESPVKKCVSSGLIYAKEQSTEHCNMYIECKSKIVGDDMPYINFFETYLEDKVGKNWISGQSPDK